jgi:hypothetical protein
MQQNSNNKTVAIRVRLPHMAACERTRKIAVDCSDKVIDIRPTQSVYWSIWSAIGPSGEAAGLSCIGQIYDVTRMIDDSK